MVKGKNLAAEDKSLQKADPDQAASRRRLLTDSIWPDDDPDRQMGCRADDDWSATDGCSKDVNKDQRQGIISREGAPFEGRVMATPPTSDGTLRRDKVKDEPSGGMKRVCYDLDVDGSRRDVPEKDVYGIGNDRQNSGSDELDGVTVMTSDMEPVPIYCVVCRDRRQHTSRYDHHQLVHFLCQMLTRSPPRGVLLTDYPTGGANPCCLADDLYWYRVPGFSRLSLQSTRCTCLHLTVYNWPGDISGITASCCHGNTSLPADGLRSPGSRSNACFYDPIRWTLFLTDHDSDQQPYSSAYSPKSVPYPCADYRSDGSDDTRHHSDLSHVYTDAEFAGELPLHRLAQGHVLARDLITELYLAYYSNLKVPNHLYSMTSYGAQNTNIPLARPLQACIHRGLHQVATMCRSARDSTQHACAEAKSSVGCVNLTNKSGFSSDSAYCSLERHVNSFLYQPLAICGGHVTRDDLDSDGEMEEDSGTEECSSSDTDVTFVMDPATYTREKLNQRTKDMLSVLKDQFSKLIQEVSEELVRLLQERHELKEQVEMRKIAVEQLVRLQSDGESVNCDSRQPQITETTCQPLARLSSKYQR